ncbi:MAG: fused DSP-PTPase phosphatase/NAD kinase-like protein, partial [Syntrophales bacterium]
MTHSGSGKLKISWVIFFGFALLVLFPMSFTSVALAAPPAASPSPAMAERIKVEGIDLLARMDTDVYRGATPTGDGLRALAREHVKTLVCLSSEAPYTKTAQELGLRVEHLPLSPFKTPSRETILRFLDITTDPSAKPVFFHCLQGEDRTGVMAAVYRMQVQGWSEEMAFAEMKEFGFGKQFMDLKKTVASYREARMKAPAGLTEKDVQASVEAGDRLLATEQFQQAIPHFQSALQKNADFTEARLGLAQALSKTGNTAQAL